MFGHLLALASIGGGASFNLFGGTITDTGVGSAVAGIRINSDGTTDENVGGSFSQINAASDWVIPNGVAPGSYRVRATLQSGTTPTTNPGLGTWLALTSNREWRNTAGTSEVVTSTLLIEIDDGAGNVQASGTYTIEADTT